MAKFYGEIGYAETKETKPGVWTEVIVERLYFGDVTRDTRKWQKADGLNDNLIINNLISVIADAYALENFFAIRYVNWMGVSWKVSNIEVQAPRLILTIGDVYNGKKARTSLDSSESFGE